MEILRLSRNRTRMVDGAFTLIELLIVIAIIAILALIAIPNFLEAQMRAKIARAYADMRTVSTGLESYFVDYNVYPDGYEARCALTDSNGTIIYPGGEPRSSQAIYSTMTTPISYLTTVPGDPFIDAKAIEGSRAANNYIHNAQGKVVAFSYESFSPMVKQNQYSWRMFQAYRNGYRYVTSSVGPRLKDLYRGQIFYIGGAYPIDNPTVMYDPTNGTRSDGLVFRTNKGSSDNVLVPYEVALPGSAVPARW